MQITGLDASLLSQTVQIDASVLQQLQQQGVNIAINPNLLTQTLQTVDPNTLQNVHLKSLCNNGTEHVLIQNMAPADDDDDEVIDKAHATEGLPNIMLQPTVHLVGDAQADVGVCIVDAPSLSSFDDNLGLSTSILQSSLETTKCTNIQFNLENSERIFHCSVSL